MAQAAKEMVPFQAQRREVPLRSLHHAALISVVAGRCMHMEIILFHRA
jgi:hypothetical protein